EILKISKEKSDSEQMISALNNVGYDYKYLKNYSEAIKYFNEAFALQQKSDNKNVASQISMLSNLAVVYQNKGDYPEAIKNMNEAKTLIEKRGNQAEMAKINDLLAVIYYNNKDYYNASLFNEKSIELAKTVADKSILQTSYKTSAQIYQALDDFQQALEYYKLHLALKDSLSLEHRLRQQELLQQQFLVERTEKELNSKIAEEEVKDLEAKRMILEREKQAQEFALLKKQQELTGAKLAQEELERQRIEQALLIAETQLETDKKGKEIIELQRLQAVKNLELKKQELADQQQKQQIEKLEQSEKLQGLQIKEQEATRNFLYGMLGLGSLIIFLIILGLLYNRRKNQLLEAKNSEIQKQKDDIERKSFELEQQTAEIEAQRDALSGTNYKLNKAYEDIKSSIHYAQRIQKAMLPQDSQIKKVLPESFLLFKPRDVVSGDFYWLGEIQEKVVIVAADCTGHGVPGAFMSLIGNDLLNEIVLAREIIEADQILNELHKGVRRALKQNETSNKDGMDLALCVINKKENEVVYAGAKNPMIFIQNNELDTIKADKMPIGGSSQEHQIGFSKKHIPLKEENTFYIFSDGYQDQFGVKNL
ncbi:MAG: tetratricopeptide repeat protein, partial [Bacteroidetes bacterium]